MGCSYQCHEIGGPWIAENPDCPVHGTNAPDHDSMAQEIVDAVGAALGVDTAGNVVETGQFEAAVDAVTRILGRE